jgi:hypothetical protein
MLHIPEFYLCKGHGFNLSADTSAYTRLGNKLKTPLNERAVFYSSTSMSYIKSPISNMAYNEKPTVMTV